MQLLVYRDDDEIRGEKSIEMRSILADTWHGDLRVDSSDRDRCTRIGFVQSPNIYHRLGKCLSLVFSDVERRE